MTPRGIRNCNPGNIRITKDKWQGLRERQNENDTASYITAVCRKLEVPTTYVPDVEEKGTMCAFAAAISEVENGMPAVMADVEAGWELL